MTPRVSELDACIHMVGIKYNIPDFFLQQINWNEFMDDLEKSSHYLFPQCLGTGIRVRVTLLLGDCIETVLKMRRVDRMC